MTGSDICVPQYLAISGELSVFPSLISKESPLHWVCFKKIEDEIRWSWKICIDSIILKSSYTGLLKFSVSFSNQLWWTSNSHSYILWWKCFLHGEHLLHCRKHGWYKATLQKPSEWFFSTRIKCSINFFYCFLAISKRKYLGNVGPTKAVMGNIPVKRRYVAVFGFQRRQIWSRRCWSLWDMFGGSLDSPQVRAISSSLSVLIRLKRQTNKILGTWEYLNFAFVECCHENWKDTIHTLQSATVFQIDFISSITPALVSKWDNKLW